MPARAAQKKRPKAGLFNERPVQKKVAPSPQHNEATVKSITKPTHGSALTQKESLELVKTIVHSSVREYTWRAYAFSQHVRDLFPRGSFGGYRYDSSDGVIPYDQFARGAVSTEKRSGPVPEGGYGFIEQESDDFVFRMMTRGEPKVDHFLNHLENGAFHVLKDGYLRAFDLFILGSHPPPIDALETWTFNFRYHKGTVRSVSISGKGQSDISLVNFRADMRALLTRIIEGSALLPNLPEGSRFLMTQIYLSKETPEDYAIPPGYTKMAIELRMPSKQEGWSTTELTLGAITSRHHSVNLGLTILNNAEGKALVPKNLSFEVIRNNGSSANHQETPAEQEPETESQTQAQLAVAHDAGVQPEHQIEGHISTHCDSPHCQEDLVTHAYLENQLNQSIYDSEEPTQTAVGIETISTQSLSSVMENRSRLMLKLNKVSSLTRKAAHPEEIHCICGWHKEEDDMVECQVCETWQHAICLGYTEEHDPRIPTDYVCWTCFGFTPGEKRENFMHYQKLARMRNALHLLWIGGYPSDHQFQAALHCGKIDIEEVIMRLRDAKVLTSRGLSRRDSQSPSVSSYLVAAKGPIFLDVVRKYYDPTLLMESYFQPSLTNTRNVFELPDTRDQDDEAPVILSVATQKRQLDEATPRHPRKKVKDSPGQAGMFSSPARATEPPTPLAGRQLVRTLTSYNLWNVEARKK